MTGYQLTLTCLSCGGGMAPVVEGRVIAGRETCAVCRCTSCRREFCVRVILSPIVVETARSRPGPVRCGTESGYKAHRNRREPPCDACKTAHCEGNKRRARARSTRVGVFT